MRLVIFLALAFVVALVVPAFAGNNAPSGSHYNLNIIGVTKGKTAPMTNSDRHTIFVSLYANPNNVDGKNYIYLTQGDHFEVCDGNASTRPMIAMTPRKPSGRHFILPPPFPFSPFRLFPLNLSWPSPHKRAPGTKNQGPLESSDK